MCNLIQEEIISHLITGSQESQVKSGRFFLLPFLSYRFDKQSLPGHLPYLYKKSDVAASMIVRTSTYLGVGT